MRLFLGVLGLVLGVAPAVAGPKFIPPCTVLYDDVTYTVHWDDSYTYEESIAVRLNTEAAVSQYGQSDIYYTGTPGTVKILSAYTTTAAGQRLDVLPDKMLDQQGDSNDDDNSYSDDAARVLIFSGLSPGAVKTYHYVISSTAAPMPGAFFSDEIFPVNMASMESSVTVLAPASMKLLFQAVGMQGGAQPDAKLGQEKFVYSLHNVPAQPPEDGEVDWNDFSPRLQMTSFANYAAAGAAYEKGAAAQAAVTPQVQALADGIVKGVTGKRAQAVALYNWVSRHIRYVSVNINDSGYVPNAADDIIAAGYGDCKDHVTLLKALLAAEGVKSSGVLVNWSDEFFVSMVPMPSFNHIITYIPQFDVYVDSTAQFAAFGVLPALERGKQALITGAPGIPSRLVTLPTEAAVPEVERAVTVAQVLADGSVQGTSQQHDSGRHEEVEREFFADMDPGTSGQVAVAAMLHVGEEGIADFTPGDPFDLSTPFTYGAHFALPDYADLKGTGTMPIPGGVPMGWSIASYPQNFSLAARTEPAPCLPRDMREETILTLPGSVTVTAIPASVDVGNAMGRFTSDYALHGDVVTRVQRLITHTNGPTCGPADYAAHRALAFAIGRDERGVVSFKVK